MSSLRDAYRGLVSTPWSSAAMVMTLGIGIGASSAVYAVFNHALLRPIPGVSRGDRLVRVLVEAPVDRPGLPPTMSVSTPYRHLLAARAMPAFQGLAGFLEPPPTSVLLRDGADVEVAEVIVVTRGYFDVLGVRPAAGRLFGAEEYEAAGSTLAVISERFWRTRFNASSDVVGGTIRLAGRPFTIVGVTRRFQGLSRTGREDIWIPWGAAEALGRGRSESAGTVIGRLVPGVPLDVATSQLAAAFEQAGPILNGQGVPQTDVRASRPEPSGAGRSTHDAVDGCRRGGPAAGSWVRQRRDPASVEESEATAGSGRTSSPRRFVGAAVSWPDSRGQHCQPGCRRRWAGGRRSDSDTRRNV
jgi:hypothetical protein